MRKIKTTGQAYLLASYFRDFIESRDGVAQPGTIAGYRSAMMLFIRFLETEKKVNEENLSFSHFSPDIVTEWRDWLHDSRGNDPATVNLRISQIRAFFYWLKKSHSEYRDVFLGLSEVEKLFVVDKTDAVEPLSEHAVKVLLATPGTSTLVGLKYTALMSFQYGTGTRSDEILSIKVGELQKDPSPRVTVTGKGRVQRIVNIPRKTMRILDKYIERVHGSAPDKDAYLFFSPIKGPHDKLTQSAYIKQMDVYSRAAHAEDSSVPEHVHPHQLRHSWATHALDNGVSLIQISRRLGHKNIATTMTYLGITPKLKQEALAVSESIAAHNTPVKFKRSKHLEDLFQ